MMLDRVKIALSKASATKPEGNTREHWHKVSQRGGRQKRIVGNTLSLLPPPALPAVITLTRHSAGHLDSDNLQSALKRVRDSVAEWCGCDDSDAAPLRWKYRQEKCLPGRYFVEIQWGPDDGDGDG